MPHQKTHSKGASRGQSTEFARPPQAKKNISKNRQRGFAQGARPYDYAYYEKEPATPQYLTKLFQQYNFAVSKRELSRYWQYYCLLREHNAALDLTRIMGMEATVLKHFIDSAMIADLTPLKNSIVDLGSGAGFPGVPLALRCPQLKVILAESRGKRVKFLTLLKDELKLDNVEIFPRSITEQTPIVADDFITRAVEIIPATLQRVANFIKPNGRVLFMKGPNCGDEITTAQQNFKGVFKMTDDLRYNLDNRDQQRRLVIFTKRETAITSAP